MTEVERRVGLAVGTGSIYRHFPSKEALLKAALACEIGRNRAVTREARSVLQHSGNTKARRVRVYRQMLDDLCRFDRLFGLMLAQGGSFPELQETIRAAVRPQDAGDEEDRAVHAMAMAALGGYHLFSIMQGQPFNGVQEDEFLEILADITYRISQKSSAATTKIGAGYDDRGDRARGLTQAQVPAPGALPG